MTQPLDGAVVIVTCNTLWLHWTGPGKWERCLGYYMLCARRPCRQIPLQWRDAGKTRRDCVLLWNADPCWNELLSQPQQRLHISTQLDEWMNWWSVAFGSYLSVELDGLDKITQQVMSVAKVTKGSSLCGSVSQLLHQRQIHPETDDPLHFTLFK